MNNVISQGNNIQLLSFDEIDHDRNGCNQKLKVAGLSSENHVKDYKGKLFYTMFPIQVNSYWYNVQFIITADKQTNVEINSECAEINRTVVITTGVAYIDIPSLVINSETGRTYTTVLISDDQVITVVGYIGKFYCSNDCDSSSFIVLPFTAFGKEYSLILQPNNMENCGIMATATNATNVIESTSERSITVGSATIQPGQNMNVVLDYLEGFHIQTHSNLTSTKIYANKPIVVISGNKYTSLKESNIFYPYRSYYSDIVYESLIHVDKWARHFIIPLIHKASSFRIRVISRYTNTTITIRDNASWSTAERGDQIEITLSQKSYFVSASNPILVYINRR
ncbi:unnamed protein product [Mytilus coruscus]|uniref:IgGFc-binding protein N-terminal domain-containing protein n=1 Tax=Mytilus coruscus TaxID=42192 RepID=A0A6J8B5R4_MYTCO|nr:unnamed protein product [Mytilus coruscus]